jgi:hypothetical protein
MERLRTLLVGDCYLYASHETSSRHAYVKDFVVTGVGEVRHLEVRPDAARLVRQRFVPHRIGGLLVSLNDSKTRL